jgi:Tol biopolymer transport system component
MAVPTFRHLREATSTPPELRVEINTPFTDDPAALALSPDGTHLVYLASVDGVSQLWLRPLASTTARPLAGTEDARFPFWSPDSRSIGFFTRRELKRIDLGGGRPQTVVNDVDGRGGTWNADGTILFAAANRQLSRVAETGGEATLITNLDPLQLPFYPRFLPGGRQFLFFAGNVQETRGIYFGSLDSDQVTRLAASDTAGAFLPPGWLVWGHGSTLWAQRLDLKSRALAGDRVMLADRLPIGAAGAFSVSDTGLVAYRTRIAAGRRQLAWFDRSGTLLDVLGAPDERGFFSPRVSPNGRRVAASHVVEGNQDIYLIDGARTTRFTTDAAAEFFPVWSPDGKQIAFGSNPTGIHDVYLKPAGGAGEPELAVESAQRKWPTDWSRDGRFILFESLDPNQDLWVLPRNGDRRPWLLLKTNFNERLAALSPNGKWVAYQSDQSGRLEVYVRPFPERESEAVADQWQVSTAGGIAPAWRSDGAEIYYIAPNGTLMATPVQVQGEVFEPGSPIELFSTRIVGGGIGDLGRNYDVARDGRFLINTVLEDASLPITLLQNWRPPATP